MLTVSRLMGLRLEAPDGDVGRLHDVLFEDEGFRLRWLVVRPRAGFRRGLVLVRPDALPAPPAGGRRSRLAAGAMRDGPDADADLPVSRGGEPRPLADLFPLRGAPCAVSDVPSRADPRLQSCRNVMGYAVLARGESLGRVRDILIDERSWTVAALLVGGPAWRGRPIAVEDVARIDWEDGTVRMLEGNAVGAAARHGVAPSTAAL